VMILSESMNITHPQLISLRRIFLEETQCEYY